MNNNFKKLLASAMALAMVTSVVPMGVNAYEKPSETPVEVNYAEVAEGKNIIKEIKKAFTGGVTIDNINTKDAYNFGVFGTVTVETLLNDSTHTTRAVRDILKNLVASGEASESELKIAEKLVGKDEAWLDFGLSVKNLKEDGIKKLYEFYNTTNGTYDGVDLNKNEYTTVKGVYDIIKYYEGFLGNITDSEIGEGLNSKEVYEEYFPAMEAAVKDYEETYADVFADKFVKALEEKVVVTYDRDATVEDLVDGAAFHREDLSKLEKVLSDIRDDKVAYDKVYYSQVEGDPDVEDILDALDAIVEDVKDVNDLFKSDAYKAIRRMSFTSLANAAVDFKADYNNDTKETKYLNELNKVNTNEIEALQTYVTDFFNEFYTVDAVQRSNGNYSLRLEETELARYLNENEKEFAESNAVVVLLTTNVDVRSEESVYDELTAGVGELDKLVKAATTDIEGIALNSTFTSSDASKILAAKKAYDELMDKTGPYYSAMTSKERRAVSANEDLISALYAKLILNGTVTKDWWIKENGQWVFYKNGLPQSNVWVADINNDWYYAGANGVMLTNSWIARDSSGSVWYYVGADGKMVTNTVVDGYTIDANGEWHA